MLTHLYEYFGNLLGCTQYGKTGYKAYAGHTGMYDVHKFMALDAYEVGYFIQQVGLSAASFGVADADVTAVGQALNMLFGERCAAPAKVLPTAPAELQAICIESDCPVAQNATCSSYDAVVEPKNTTTGASTNGTGGIEQSNDAQGTSAQLMSTVTLFIGLLVSAWLL